MDIGYKKLWKAQIVRIWLFCKVWLQFVKLEAAAKYNSAELCLFPTSSQTLRLLQLFLNLTALLSYFYFSTYLILCMFFSINWSFSTDGSKNWNKRVEKLKIEKHLTLYRCTMRQSGISQNASLGNSTEGNITIILYFICLRSTCIIWTFSRHFITK